MTSLGHSQTNYPAEGGDRKKSEELSEMELLLQRLPVLNEYFQLHSKIGQGTFSTVYLATLRNGSSTQKYAVKHLTQTCEQSKITNELRCLQEIGGKDNVVPAELCITNGSDCVTFIMPYLAHPRFLDYMVDMDAEETRFYMKNLFIALRRVHSFNIIHRDVKPNNFLYNRETKEFLLVDFGLAQLVTTPNAGTSKDAPADENEPIDYSKKRKRAADSSEEEEEEEGKKSPSKGSKRIALKSKDSNARVSVPRKAEVEKVVPRGKDDLNSPVKQWTDKPDVDETSVKPRVFNAAGSVSSGSRRKLLDASSTSFKSPEARTPTTSKIAQAHSFTPLVPGKSSNGNFVQVRNSRVVRQRPMSSTSKSNGSPRGSPSTSSFPQPCLCSGKGAVCSICSSKKPMFAPRAGTSGFRPPEVLFRYLHQTTAVDMWAAGVLMLCILSGCYPFFYSSTDLASLAEIMTIFGTERTIQVAKKFGRRILCSEHRKGVDLKKLCRRLRARSTRRSRGERGDERNEPKCRDCFQTIRKDGCICPSDEPSSEGEQEPFLFPDSAFDLLYRLLDLDPSTRITAAEALNHPFITGQ